MNDKPSNSLLKVESLFKFFVHERRTIEVLKGIDLEVSSGEMVSIIGKSGVGKSTFLHVIGTLDSPTKGKVFFEGRDIFELSPPKLARFRNQSIGFVFQFHHLLPEFTALENTMMPGLIQGISKKEMRKRASILLEEVGLKDRMNHRPGELSGGEQQRVALARALIMNPKLILADEPTGNLDVQTSEGIHELFFKLNLERKITMILVTHNHSLAFKMPRVLLMKDGILEEQKQNIK